MEMSRLPALTLTCLLATQQAIAQDEIYVSNNNSNSVTVYAINANGNVAPLRVLAGNLTGLGSPSGIAVDLINNGCSSSAGPTYSVVSAPGERNDASAARFPVR
jgi:hypothetical protein